MPVPSSPKFACSGDVGMRRCFDHVFGTVMLIEKRDDGFWYLLDEHPHAIGQDGKWYWHPLNPYPGNEPPKPGMMWLCWWPEKKLKKRKPGTVCQCKWCKKYRMPAERAAARAAKLAARTV